MTYADVRKQLERDRVKRELAACYSRLNVRPPWERNTAEPCDDSDLQARKDAAADAVARAGLKVVGRG